MKTISILLILFFFLCIDAFSQIVSSKAYAVLKDSTLTFYYNDKQPQGAYDVEKNEGKLSAQYGSRSPSRCPKTRWAC